MTVLQPDAAGESGHRIDGVTFTNVDITVPGGNGTMSTACASNDPGDYNPKAIDAARLRLVRPQRRQRHLHGQLGEVQGRRRTPGRHRERRERDQVHPVHGPAEQATPTYVGFQNVTGYCLTDSHNTSGGALRGFRRRLQ